MTKPRGSAKVIPADPEKLFLPYQDRWINDGSRLKLMEKSRQIGISWSTAFSCVARQAASKSYDTWVSSRDELQAKLFLDDCKAFAGLLNKAAEALGLTEIVVEGAKMNAFVLRFPNGTAINSLSSNPNAQAGKRGTRVLDEFALHPDPAMLYAIAYPGITWGGQLEIISTHRGSGNFFNQLVREIKEKGNPKGISLHTVTLQDALDAGFLFKLQQKLPEEDERMGMDEATYFDFIRAGTVDEESFQQEYMCVPSDDASAFLPYDLIDACCFKASDNLFETSAKDGKGSIRKLVQAVENKLPAGELFAGFDVGRHHDLSVLWVFERVGGVMLTRAVIEFDRIEFSRQEEICYPIFQACRRVCIDASGLGMQLAERAEQRFGKYKIEGIKFTAPVKEELAYPVRAAFEDRSLRIPFDKQVTADLRKVRKETTASGNVRFSATSDKDGHADRFWALALALHAAKNPASYFFTASI